jgi:hypothetical protein
MALLLRNPELQGRIRSLRMKLFTEREQTKQGTSKAGWRLVVLEGDNDFFQSLNKLEEDHRFTLGGGYIHIKGGDRRAPPVRKGRARQRSSSRHNRPRSQVHNNLERRPDRTAPLLQDDRSSSGLRPRESRVEFRERNFGSRAPKPNYVQLVKEQNGFGGAKPKERSSSQMSQRTSEGGAGNSRGISLSATKWRAFGRKSSSKNPNKIPIPSNSVGMYDTRNKLLPEKALSQGATNSTSNERTRTDINKPYSPTSPWFDGDEIDMDDGY